MPPAEPPLTRVVIPNGPAETAGSTLWNRPRVVPKDLGIAFAIEGDGQPDIARICEVVLDLIVSHGGIGIGLASHRQNKGALKLEDEFCLFALARIAKFRSRPSDGVSDGGAHAVR